MPDPFDIPSTGPISLQTIQQEYGGPASPIPINSYYAGGAYVPAGTTGNLGPIPTAGTVSFDHYRGSAAGPPPSGVVGINNTYNGNTNPNKTSPWNFSVSIGPADPNRIIVLVVSLSGGFSMSNLNATINGSTMTKGVEAYNQGFGLPCGGAIFASPNRVTSGTSANFSVTWDGGEKGGIISVFSVITAGGVLRAFDSDANAVSGQELTVNIEAPSNACIFSCSANSIGNSNPATYTTSGFTRATTYRNSTTASCMSGFYQDPTSQSGSYPISARNTTTDNLISMLCACSFNEF